MTFEDRMTNCRGFHLLFGQSLISRVGAILELENYCRRYPCKKKKVNVTMAREPSPYVSWYFILRYMVAVQDSANACIRAVVADAVAVHWEMGIARRYWEGELD